MPSPGVQWREPLHNLWVLVRYDFVHIYDVVMAIHYVTAVDIAVANRVPIRCVVHVVSKVIVESRYALAITVVAMLEFALAGLKKKAGCGSNSYNYYPIIPR